MRGHELEDAVEELVHGGDEVGGAQGVGQGGDDAQLLLGGGQAGL